MKRLRHDSLALLFLFVFTLLASQCFAFIKSCDLTKEEAKEKYGITMHARKNGDEGIQVWLEFKQEGRLEKFMYAELRMEDSKGKHLISAELQPNPRYLERTKDTTAVAFSVAADRLEQCRFFVVCYRDEGAHDGYYLKVKDFLDLKNPVTEK